MLLWNWDRFIPLLDARASAALAAAGAEIGFQPAGRHLTVIWWSGIERPADFRRIDLSRMFAALHMFRGAGPGIPNDRRKPQP
jgi:hypothetical protein